MLINVRLVILIGTLGSAVLLWRTGVDLEANQSDTRPLLTWVGVTAHAWGAWVPQGTEVEDWVDDATVLCATEEFCEVNVYEGAEFATHEYPVPEENRSALKWVFLYRHHAMPRIVVEEAHDSSLGKKRRWTFE